MDKLSNKELQHLYNRTGFGISATELRTLTTFKKNQVVDRLFLESQGSSMLSLDLSILDKDKKGLTREEKKALKKIRNQKMFELNFIWFKQMVTTKQTLREKMVLFFHEHFAVRIKNPKANIHLNNILREHALGSFAEMLMEVSKSPAMIAFLNNKQNKKDHPNENFAREVMELFTLGRDNGYTETDIKEAARAFTGWSFSKEGKFVFRKSIHDDGEKTILGKTGNFKGEDVIKILLEQKQTAKYMVEKLYNYLVNPIPNPRHINKLTNVFYESGYNLEKVIRAIFESDWFYKKENIGVKIKSPIQYLATISKQFHVSYGNPKALILAQKKLNQVLFFPPNVAGWPGGKYWIDSSTLMLRLKLASIILNDGVIDWTEKSDMPESAIAKMEERKARVKSKIARKVKAKPNWGKYLNELKLDKKEDLISFFIQPELSKPAKQVVADLDETDKQDFIVELLSLPEYQLY